MRIVWEEVKKIWRTPKLLLCMSTLSICIVGAVYIQMNNTILTGNENILNYRAFNGPLTQEKYEFIANKVEELEKKYPMEVVKSGEYLEILDTSDDSMTGNDYDDKGAYQWLKTEFERIINFYHINEEALMKQEEKIVYLEAHDLKRQANKIKNENKRFQDRGLISYEYIDGMERYFKSPFPSMMSLIAMIFIAISSISTEMRQDMSQINESTLKGKREICFGKYLALIGTSLFVTLFFELITIMSFSIFDFVRGFNVPIYQLKSFFFFPYNWSVLLALIIHSLIKGLVISLFIGISVLILLNKKSLSNNLILLILVGFIFYSTSFLTQLQGINMIDLKLTGFILLLISFIGIFEYVQAKKRGGLK